MLGQVLPAKPFSESLPILTHPALQEVGKRPALILRVLGRQCPINGSASLATCTSISTSSSGNFSSLARQRVRHLSSKNLLRSSCTRICSCTRIRTCAASALQTQQHQQHQQRLAKLHGTKPAAPGFCHRQRLPRRRQTLPSLGLGPTSDRALATGRRTSSSQRRLSFPSIRLPPIPAAQAVHLVVVARDSPSPRLPTHPVVSSHRNRPP